MQAIPPACQNSRGNQTWSTSSAAGGQYSARIEWMCLAEVQNKEHWPTVSLQIIWRRTLHAICIIKLMQTPEKRLPSLGHYEAPPSFKNDLDVLDRYQAFSAEILRIALLGLSALGVASSSVIWIRRSP